MDGAVGYRIFFHSSKRGRIWVIFEPHVIFFLENLFIHLYIDETCHHTMGPKMRKDITVVLTGHPEPWRNIHTDGGQQKKKRVNSNWHLRCDFD
jgi:hypothetical protein